MTEEKTTKAKLSPRARKQIQRNADAIAREIQLLKREVELLKEINAVRLEPALYKLAPGYQPTMLNQLDERYLELSRKRDELKYAAEISMLEGRIGERSDQHENYISQLSERA
jgi:hypothetical protein